jgi:iron complex outermembrane recepter protein
MSTVGRIRTFISLGGIAALASLPLELAVAAEPGDAGVSALGEIVVTARKRSESVQDVPISVAALGTDDLRGLNIATSQELGAAVPGLIANDYGNPVITVFTLRGVQQFDFGDHQESPVAVFTDGSYVPYLSAVGLNLFDLERVEVLRGPQGTLFGRNATGGVIQLVSARPTAEFTGYGELRAGNYGALRAEGAVSGPLGGGWLGRLSVMHDEHDGYYRNALGGRKGDADTTSWRAQLARPLSDRGDVSLVVRGSRDRTSTSPYGAVAAYPGADGLFRIGDAASFADFCAGYFGTVVATDAVDCLSGDADPGDPFRLSHNRTGGGFERDYLGATLTFNWDIGGATLTSITSYGELDKGYEDEDSDATSLDVLFFGQSVDADDWSQELRLAGETERLNWLVGAYALRIDGNYGTNIGFFPFDPNFVALVGNTYTLDTETWAVFGQTDIKLSDAWTLTAGLRWTDDTKNLEMATPCTGPGCDLFGFTDPSLVQGSGFDDTVPGAETERQSDNWDAKLLLSWRPSDALLVYGGVSRGTKAGGYNAGASAFYTVDEVIFDDEELTSFEIGFKSTLADGRVWLNASVYDYDYKDVQVFSQNGPFIVTFNRDGQVRGGELEMQARFDGGWDARLGMSVLDTEIDPVENVDIITGEVTSEKQALPNSPELSVMGQLAKEWALPQGTLFVSGSGRWIDERKLNLIDHPGTRADAYSVFDLSAGYRSADARWEVTAYCLNVGDEEYRIVATPFVSTNGAIIQIFGPPRTYGASLRVNF